MYVLNRREELISYYERHGYTKKGIIQHYPLSLNVGIPKLEVSLIELIKHII
ncbi:hypothetical protein KPC_3341 [Acinetobacter stercoris]|uniref:Uncharacterized protein n=1 Tax=Acinetobacter stercoris TaxID=2126983 RepID=A0A2U3N3F2_9GAMM|nr:hypothetical protein KPC_3341 [Acinetobacter stercoris]